MADDKIDNEIYSLIFTSLKHPIRRRILRMLSVKPMAFSEIQESLTMDSGHLSYHIDSLGDLITRTEEKYRLSSFGQAAVRLMGGVEEQTPLSVHCKLKPLKIVCKLYPFLLIAIVLTVGFHFLSYTTPTEITDSWLTQTVPSGTTFVNLQSGKAIEFNVTVVYVKTNQTRGIISLDGVGTNTLTFQKAALINDLTTSEVGSMWLDLAVNRFNLPPALTDINSGGNWPNEDINVTLTILRPDSTIVTYMFVNNYINFNTNHFTVPLIDMSESGTYRFELTNKDAQDLNATVQPNLKWQLMDKPYFYYGVTATVAAVGCLGIAIIALAADYCAFNQDKKRKKSLKGISRLATTTAIPILRKHNGIYFGIALIVIVVAMVPLSTFVIADNMVSNALNNLQIKHDRNGSNNFDSYAIYHTRFLVTNNADINLNLDLNFSAYVAYDEQSTKYSIGTLTFEDQNAKTDQTTPIQVFLNVTSTDALNILRGRSSHQTIYTVTVTAQSNYAFWDVTKQKTFNFTLINPRF